MWFLGRNLDEFFYSNQWYFVFASWGYFLNGFSGQFRMSSLMRIRDIMAVSSDPIRINLIEWCPIFLGMITLRGKMTFFSGECALIVWLIELFEEKKIHLLLYKILQFLSSLLNPAKHMIHFLAALYSANHLFIIYHQCPMSASVQMFCIYESFSDVPESCVWLRPIFKVVVEC